jgi:hypothetical protein
MEARCQRSGGHRPDCLDWAAKWPIFAAQEPGTSTLWETARSTPPIFQVVFAALTIFYDTLGISYLVDPAGSVSHFSSLDKLRGGAAIPHNGAAR